jgi:hypothetical protein
MECYYCDRDLTGLEKWELDGGWNTRSGNFICEPCAERQFDDYMEARIG